MFNKARKKYLEQKNLNNQAIIIVNRILKYGSFEGAAKSDLNKVLELLNGIDLPKGVL